MLITYPMIREAEEFHGFRTVHSYELECAKAGQTTRRVPCFGKDGTPAFALITVCPTGNPASFDGLDIITADEAHCLHSGAIRHDGSDFDSVLSRFGYHTRQQEEATVLHEEEDDGITQFSLFPC